MVGSACYYARLICVAPGSRRLLKSQRSRAKQLVAMNVASGDDLQIDLSQESHGLSLIVGDLIDDNRM